MDLGVFRRKKSTFWAWIVLPALCVVVASQSIHVYCLFVEARLLQRQAVLGILADVEQRMNVSKDIVLGFSMMGSSPARTAEDVTSRIAELSRRHRFLVNSLQVRDMPEAKTGDAQALVIDLKGEGNILSLMQFLNEMQSPQHLTVVDGATLQLKQQGTGGQSVYDCELTVKCLRDALKGAVDA